jgi:hypothetical protein
MVMSTDSITFCPHCTLSLTVCVCLPCQGAACHGFHRGRERPCDHCGAGVPTIPPPPVSGASGPSDDEARLRRLERRHGITTLARGLGQFSSPYACCYHATGPDGRDECCACGCERREGE